MALRFILLVLPALTLARIDVEISGNYRENAKDLNLYYNGKDVGIIKEAEKTTFKVNDNTLKHCAQMYSKKWPDEVFFGGELDRNHKVSRKLVPRNGKIFYVSETPTLIAHQIFKNNSTIHASFNVGISQPVMNRVWSSWHRSGELCGIIINYDIKIKVPNIGGVPSFSYTSSWGQVTLQSQTVTVGASSNMDMMLKPGEAVVARLEATRGFVKVIMEYNASLYGDTIVRYANQGSDFYFMPIDSCMEDTALVNSYTSQEHIDIDFFSDSRVIFKDLHSGVILKELR